jgi:hypothetical protein
MQTPVGGTSYLLPDSIRTSIHLCLVPSRPSLQAKSWPPFECSAAHMRMATQDVPCLIDAGHGGVVGLGVRLLVSHCLWGPGVKTAKRRGPNWGGGGVGGGERERRERGGEREHSVHGYEVSPAESMLLDMLGLGCLCMCRSQPPWLCTVQDVS